MTSGEKDSGIRETHLTVRRTARVAVLAGPAAPGGPPDDESGTGGGPGEGMGHGALWIALHGYRQLARRFLRPLRGHLPPGVVVLAPEGASRFYLEGSPGPHRQGDPVGASWMTREDREAEISDYVAALDDIVEAALEGDLDGVPPLAPGGSGHGAGSGARRSDGAGIPVGVLGFSQGVHTAARWLAASRVLPVLPGGAGLAGGEGEGRLGPLRAVMWGAALPADLPGQGMVGLRSRVGAAGRLVLVRGEEDPLRTPEAEAAEEGRLEEAGIPFGVRMHPGGHRIDGALAALLLPGSGADPARLR